MSLLHSPKIVTNGLVLCLDAASRKSYPGTGNVWRDLSGNARDGTLTNGVTYSTDNKGSMILDGADDYVSLGSDTLISTTQPFTVYLWMNHNPARLFNRMITLKSTATEPLGIAFVNGNSSGYNGLYLSSANGWVKGSNGYYPTINVWGLLTVTYNGTGSTTGTNFKIYWNSVDVGFTANASAGSVSVPNSSFLAARRTTADDQVYRGRMGSFLLYNTLHNNEQISQNFNATRGRYGI